MTLNNLEFHSSAVCRAATLLGLLNTNGPGCQVLRPPPWALEPLYELTLCCCVSCWGCGLQLRLCSAGRHRHSVGHRKGLERVSCLFQPGAHGLMGMQAVPGHCDMSYRPHDKPRRSPIFKRGKGDTRHRWKEHTWDTCFGVSGFKPGLPFHIPASS